MSRLELSLVFVGVWFAIVGIAWVIVYVGDRADDLHEVHREELEEHLGPKGNVDRIPWGGGRP